MYLYVIDVYDNAGVLRYQGSIWAKNASDAERKYRTLNPTVWGMFSVNAANETKPR